MTSPQPNPIYIIGDDALACYLAAHFQDIDENPIILSSPSNTKDLSTNGVTIKEEFTTLRKKHYRFSTASIMTTDAKAVIITVTSSELNSALAFISRDKINNAPLLCFSLLKDSGYIQDILGTPVCKAHFTGWLNKHDQQISLKGRQPTINIYSTINNSTQQKLSALFNSAGFEISFLDSEKDFFWPMFTLNAACSIICSAYDKPIHQILKNKQFRAQLDEIINEFITLAAADDVKMNFSDIMDTIMSIPGGYIFPLHNDFRTGRHRDFHRISSLIKQSARQANIKTPVLNELMARIYEIYLSIT